MRVVIIGGGVAGLRAAQVVREHKGHPVIVERAELGGKLRGWHKLFPSLTPASEVLSALPQDFETVHGQAARLSEGGVVLADGRVVEGDAVIVATGFELFHAERKEELGYGVYDNVFTTVDVERMMNEGAVLTKDGAVPRRIALLHCVGSRDEKAGQRHCSRVCCITAVKQAMELRHMIPDSEVFNFYMDMRMFGAGWEELYRRAQEESRVQFIRGRISEASETIDKRVWIKAEDTLLGRPLRMTVDMLVLAVGMMAPAVSGASSGSGATGGSTPAASAFGLSASESGFVEPRDWFGGSALTSREGVFVAGAASSPKTLGETLDSATAAALEAVKYLKNNIVSV